MQTFGLDLKKMKTTFCDLFGKNWSYSAKVAFFDTEYEQQFMPITFITWNWWNLKHTVRQHAFQYHWAILDGFFKKCQEPTILDETVETK